MKLTQSQLRQIIREELSRLDERSSIDSIMDYIYNDFNRLGDSLSKVLTHLKSSSNSKETLSPDDKKSYQDLFRMIDKMQALMSSIKSHKRKMGL